MVGHEEDYESLSSHYLENGLRFLQDGDLEKAGEFLWGSMAAALKAVAAGRGIRLRSHRDVRSYARQLSQHAGDHSIWDDYVKAEHLHASFYEAFLEREDVVALADDVRRRIGILLQMATQSGEVRS